MGKNIAVITVVLLTIALVFFAARGTQERCKEWADQHGLVCKNLEARAFSCGPFFRLKDEWVYRMEALEKTPEDDSRSRVFWFKLGWGMKVKEEVSPDKYVDREN